MGAARQELPAGRHGGPALVATEQCKHLLKKELSAPTARAYRSMNAAPVPGESDDEVLFFQREDGPAGAVVEKAAAAPQEGAIDGRIVLQ